MKRICSLLLAVCVLFSARTPVSAADFEEPVEPYAVASEACVWLDDQLVFEGSFEDAWNDAVARGQGVVQLVDNVIGGENGLGQGVGFFRGGLFVPAGLRVGLDLNGFSLNRNLANGSSSERTISILSETAVMDIYDSVGGGIIEGCHTEGSAIYVAGTLNFNGGSIRDNTVGHSTVYIADTGHMVMSTPDNDGQRSAEVVINKGLDGSKCGGIYVEGLLSLGGDVRVQNNGLNVLVACDDNNNTGRVELVRAVNLSYRIFMSSETGSAALVFGSENYNIQATDSGNFMSDDDERSFSYFENTLVWHRKNTSQEAQLDLGSGRVITGSFAGMWNVAASFGRGTVTLLSNVTASKEYDTDLCTSFGQGIGFDGYGRLTVNDGVQITLNLNNKVLDKGMSNASAGDVSGTLFMVRPGGVFKIQDPTNSGIIQGAYGRETGAVYVCENGTFYLEGGIISNNKSVSGVGGIRVDGTAYLSGGRVVNNDIGVIASSTGHVILSNEVRVYDNTHDGAADNLKIMDGSDIRVVAPLSDVANVHVNMEDAGMTVVAHKDASSSSNLTDSDANVFIVDNSKKVVRVEGDTLVIGEPVTGNQASYTSTDGTTVKAGTFVDCMNEASMKGGTVRLLEDVDVDVDSWFNVRSKDVTLALNGHHLHLGSSEYEIFNVIHGGSLTIRDNGSPVSTRTIIDQVSVDADNLVQVFKNWQTNKASWDDVTGILDYYAIEEADGFYNLVHYSDNYSDVGRIHMNSPVNSAACINVSGGTVVFRGGLFTGTSPSAKFCSVTSGGTATINGGTFAVFSNGVFDVTGGTVDFRDGSFIGNKGVSCFTFANSSKGTLLGGRFLGNSAYNGSVALVSGSSNVSFGSNVVFSLNNASNHGGAIAQTGAGSVTLDGVKFKGSFGSLSGAVYSEDRLTVKNSKFVGCWGGNDSYGGGIRMKSGSVTNTDFIQCEASNGGGLHSNGTLTLSDAAFSACKAFSVGGGVSLENSTAQMTGITMTNCKSSGGGGGLAFLQGSAGKISGRFTGCEASANGGAILVREGAGAVTIQDVAATKGKAQRGGGLCIENDGSKDSVLNSSFNDNTAKECGGGIAVASTSSISLQLTEVQANNNKLVNASTSDLWGRGGGIAVVNGSIRMTGGHVNNNSAYVGGGVFVAWNKSSFSSVEIRDNEVSQGGGGIAIREANVDLTGCTIQNNSVSEESTSMVGDTGGGGILVRQGGSMTVLESTISNNVSFSGGGGVKVEKGVFRATKSYILRNTASQGGGIDLINTTNSVCFLIDTRVTGNIATDRGGGIIGSDGSVLNIGGQFVCIDNTSLRDMDNVNLRGSNICNIVSALTPGSEIGITTTNAPGPFSPVMFAKGVDAADGVQYFFHDNVEWQKKYDPDIEYCVFFDEDGSIVDGDNVAINGVLVQYYAYQKIPATSAHSSYFKFDILNTKGGNLPSNSIEEGSSYATMNAFVDTDTGEVLMREMLSKIFKSRDFNYNEHLQLEVLNRFMEEDGWVWNANEVWILKDGKAQSSLVKDDWDIVVWDDGKTLGELGVEKGDCIRIVCSSVQDTKDVDVEFYDYDITDGKLYRTQDDAVNARNGVPMSTYENGTNMIGYVRTQKYGINSDANYAGSKYQKRFAFGNASVGMQYGWATVDGFNINSGNPGIYRRCFFGLAEGLDDNGHIIWNKEVDVPRLFNEGDAIGKTSYNQNEYGLRFKRDGDTYTLSDVLGANLSDLDKLTYPVYNGRPWTHIVTNHFWPMDTAPSAGADGHDWMSGGYADKDVQKAVGVDMYQGLWHSLYVQSDNGEPHNNYFGMHFNIKFSMSADYVAPLGYYFFGDDDMFVFLDGKLICDLGGVHQSAGSYTDLRDYIEEGDTDEHVLSFFYTERGASGSTCWMQFNLPHNVSSANDWENFSFSKVDQNDEPLSGTVFGLYTDKTGGDLIKTVVSSEDGFVSFSGLDYRTVYYIKEISAPEFYEMDTNVYVLSYGNGAWGLYKLDDADKTPVTKIINVYKENMYDIMPETGGPGTILFYVLGSGIIAGGVGLAVFTRRRRRAR